MGGFDEYLTVKEVVRIFKVHRRTLLRWADDGRFPRPIKINGELRWRARDIQNYQDQLVKEAEGMTFSDQTSTAKKKERGHSVT